MILAGLNEDVWPEAADPGPWLSRGMRLAVGLEPPERQHGHAAHDFVMAMGNAEVIVAWADRIGGSPATPSRLVQRLEAFLGEDVTQGCARARQALDRRRRSGSMPPASARAPRSGRCRSPRSAMRPKRLSVTEIETLFRSPYDIYARHVLQLQRARSARPGARRPRARHADPRRLRAASSARACRSMRARIRRLERTGRRGVRRARSHRRAPRHLAPPLRASRPGSSSSSSAAGTRDIAERHAEIKGEWHVPDRLHARRQGRPRRRAQATARSRSSTSRPARSRRRRDEGLRWRRSCCSKPAMARAGGFPGIAPRRPSALTYIKIGSGDKAYRPDDFRLRDDMTCRRRSTRRGCGCSATSMRSCSRTRCRWRRASSPTPSSASAASSTISRAPTNGCVAGRRGLHLSRASSRPAARRRCARNQMRAADPTSSVWVAANAGSGKTLRAHRSACCGCCSRASRRTRSSASPTPRPRPPRCASRVAERARRSGRVLDDADARAPSSPSSATPPPDAAHAAPRAHPLRPCARDAGRAQDPDHPRLLRERAAPLPARGRRAVRLRGARGARARRAAPQGARGGARRRAQRRPARSPMRSRRCSSCSPTASSTRRSARRWARRASCGRCLRDRARAKANLLALVGDRPQHAPRSRPR